ncbi:hypothetical protein K0M31_004554 [Melipona bicolor]|uniref:Uncharacterized protein n=1 Tax=Melipona bicolor TaxID=60889 RepID=A0AA40FXB6_9HYME|nr:hypothetical protein K0M31_004554 [Melipona bicolor]
MDLVYVPEVLTYGFFRAHQYPDYEQPWNKDYFNCGKSMQLHSQRSSHHEQKVLSKKHCYLCRENKRRSLATYIRAKSRRDSCQEIYEEEEYDCEDTIEETVKIDDKTSERASENNKYLEINNTTKNAK